MSKLEALQTNWNRLGQLDPLYAILNSKRGSRWSEQEFFQTGRDDIAQMVRKLDELGLCPQRGRVLDFGCGVGRLTQPLATHFQHASGVDIAPSMVERARTYNQYGDRCDYRVLATGDLSEFEDDSFDMVYSVLVLQHLPVMHAETYVREFFRVVRPGGCVVFQIPSYDTPPSTLNRIVKRFAPKALLSIYRHFEYGEMSKIPVEFNSIPSTRVHKIVAELKGTLVYQDGEPAMPTRYWVKVS